MGGPTLTISFMISYLLVLTLCITVLCMVTLSQVQVPAWSLTGSNGCDNDSMPGGTMRMAQPGPMNLKRLRRHMPLLTLLAPFIFSV